MTISGGWEAREAVRAAGPLLRETISERSTGETISRYPEAAPTVTVTVTGTMPILVIMALSKWLQLE